MQRVDRGEAKDLVLVELPQLLVGEAFLGNRGLHRLEQQGLIESEWGSSENNRQAKFYQLTRAGRKQLAEETKQWERISEAVARILTSS